MVSIDPKHGKLKKFHKPLTDLKNHKPTTIETKRRKDRIINNVNQFYKKFFDTYKKNYDSKKNFDPNQIKIFGKKKQKPKSTEKNTERDVQKPLWFGINRKQFEELTGDFQNNQDNNDFKININKRTYDEKKMQKKKKNE